MDARKEGPPRKPCFSAQPHVVRWLSPFFLTCAVYFLLWIPEDQPSWVGALVKCMPILSLVVFLWTVPSGGGHHFLLQGALLCSAVGDACLIWPEGFLHGVAAFTLAHLLYLWAFGLTPLQPGLLLRIVLACILCYCLLLWHLPPNMVLPLMAYSLVLAAMLWRGLARGGSASWGALLFMLSDAVLAWNTFAQPLPHARLVIMTTYYAAQMLITLSVFQGPRLKST